MGRAIALMSASGGQGKSTLACCLAAAAIAAGCSVLLLDCGAGHGALRWLLGEDLGSAYDLGDASRGACLMGDAVFRCDEGFYMMPSAANDAGVTAAKTCRIIDAAKKSFDLVIADCPSAGWTDAQTYSQGCDLSIICSTARRMDLSSASWLRRALPPEDEKCRLVLMKFSAAAMRRGECANIDASIDLICARLLGVIPYDISVAAGNGLPPDSPTAAAAGNIIGRIFGQEIPLDIKSII
ncbi:MAG: hypothetical protein FWE86_03665 [Oscillospiraceae bacterium]|nr:hypothetical protein [Oscillospiraceae bacterium]